MDNISGDEIAVVVNTIFKDSPTSRWPPDVRRFNKHVTSLVSRYQFALLLHSVVVGSEQEALQVAKSFCLGRGGGQEEFARTRRDVAPRRLYTQ